jgi:acyl-CoA synthetase (NDP forming)
MTDERQLVPEPEVKDALRRLGVTVPAGINHADPDQLAAAARELTPPLVLKAFGAGLLHKTEVGAVRLGLQHDELGAAARQMTARLEAAGLRPAGFLVEEQCRREGIELIVGLVERPPYGHLALLGLGGTLTEVIDRGVTRLAPLSAGDVEEMLQAFPAARLFGGVRGGPALDRTALAGLLAAVAGEQGLLARFGSQLSELECNPVLLSPSGAVALDARLLLHEHPPPPPPEAAGTDFGPLFRPRSVAVAGASASKQGFGNRSLAAYRAAGWTEGLYAIHPTATVIDGVPAVPSLGKIPGGVDYLLVTVAAAQTPVLIEASAGQARFAQVLSGGFGETGEDGRSLEDELLRAARAAGVRLLGPNCLGSYCPDGRQVFTLGASLEAGPVSVVSQSGGLAGDITTVGVKRGIRFAKVVSAGNAIDVTPGELLDWLVDDPDTRVLGLYLEGPRDGGRIVRALRRARGRKPVVVLAGGTSSQGAQAVASHTGSMAGDERLWDAICAATGAMRVATVEDLVGALLYLQHYAGVATPADAGVLVIGVGGGASVLATDACDRAGLRLLPVPPDVQQGLRSTGFGAGTSLANPMEVPIGPAAPPELVTRALDPVVAAQPYSDVLVHVNVQSYYSYGSGALDSLLALVAQLASWRPEHLRLALAARNLDAAAGDGIDQLRTAAARHGLPLYPTLDAAAAAIAAARRFAASPK